MADTVPELLDTAIQAARRGGHLLAACFEQVRTIEYKGGIDLVTDADKASEAELIAFIGARHPGHAILAEESGATAGTTHHRWLLDPLDGTTNYAHRIPHFCVSVAVEGPSGLLAAAVYDPIRNEMFSAGQGLGSQLNGAPMSVATTERLERSVLCTGFPYDVRENPQAPLGLFNRLIKRVQGVRRMGAAALDLAYVAAGRFEGFFEFGLKPWDLAAGALLIWEAGGEMAQIDGQPLDLATGDVLACAPGIATELKSECARFLSEIAYQPRQK